MKSNHDKKNKVTDCLPSNPECTIDVILRFPNSRYASSVISEFFFEGQFQLD
jgi:hypothetical protein